MTQVMCKTYKAVEAEARNGAWGCRYCAENGAGFLADEAIETDADRSYVRHLPLGPILAVMPGNFPLWQVVRFAAPALMAGNVGPLQHCPDLLPRPLAPHATFRPGGFPRGP